MYRPTPDQALVKSRIHSGLRDQPWLDASKLTVAELCQRADEPRLKTWLADAEFRSWLLDANTVRAKIDAALERAVDALCDIVSDPDVGPRGKVTAASVVRAAEVLAQLGGLYPEKTKTVVFADRELAALDETQLESQIKLYESRRKRQLAAGGADE